MIQSPFPQQVERAVLRFFEDLATPVSLKAAILLRHRCYDDLVQLNVHPRDYSSAAAYWLDASAVSLLRKCEGIPTSTDLRAAAEKVFLDCEKECLRTNRRLYPYLAPGISQDEVSGVHDVIRRAQKFIARLLGPAPIIFDGRHGPGTTFGDTGMKATIPDKMSNRPTLTPDAYLSLFRLGGSAWARALEASGLEPSFVSGNRFATVPKDSTKDRGIASEPSLNMFYQLGIGSILRQRLKRVGIDLDRGQDIHRRVACEASIQGHLATLDLSNASDTISRNLVKLLLPPDWFRVLDDLRSKKTLFRKEWYLLEKFSSMGNGFTFELETLVFLGLCVGVDRFDQFLPGVNLFVYGDDIIIPTDSSKDVIAMLSFFGMSINKKKTFVDGPFRESCGGDFFLGVDVRPYFLKEIPNEPQQLISFANGIRRASKGAPDRFTVVRNCWFGVLDALPVAIRQIRGPEGLGDLLIHDDEERWRFRWRNSIRYFRVYKPARFRKVSWANFTPEVILASALYGVPSGADNRHRRDPCNGGFVPRDSVLGYRLGWTPLS